MMRVSMNLSRRPFTNRRLFWIGVAAVFFISLWFGLWITARKTVVSAQADAIQSRIQAQEQSVEQLKQEQEQRKQSEQKTVLTQQDLMQLAAARELIVTRAFSWNRLIGDFERYVPKDARILSIKVEDVSAGPQGAVALLEVKALAKSVAQMTEMLTSFERSGGLFVAEGAQFNQDAAEDTGEVPFTITNLAYDPSRGAGQ
jgi:Tfp pilus assembly protein PilN